MIRHQSRRMPFFPWSLLRLLDQGSWPRGPLLWRILNEEPLLLLQDMLRQNVQIEHPDVLWIRFVISSALK